MVYHLLDDLGYHDIDWRKGTVKDSTTPDSGRDIEATLSVTDPDGDRHSEIWFVQAKRHVKTINPSSINDAIHWAEAEGPDVLLFVTSGALSNPTKSWIRDYERTHRPRFRIKYWERPRLERLLEKHPVVLEKFFPTKDPVNALNEGLRDPLAKVRATPTGKLLRDMERLRRDVDQALRT